MSVIVHFLPDRVSIEAEPGEPLLDVAQRAGVSIPTGCLMGSCYACEVEIAGTEHPVRACLTSVPSGESETIVHCYDDPTW